MINSRQMSKWTVVSQRKYLDGKSIREAYFCFKRQFEEIPPRLVKNVFQFNISVFISERGEKPLCLFFQINCFNKLLHRQQKSKFIWISGFFGSPLFWGWRMGEEKHRVNASFPLFTKTLLLLLDAVPRNKNEYIIFKETLATTLWKSYRKKL